jgi:hypothetical protein
MKVAYLDLGVFGIHEDYSLLPNRYGGGRIFASEMKEFEDFHIFASPECFANVDPEENIKNCHGISNQQKTQIISGERVIEAIPQLSDFDILFHCHTHLHFNTKNDLRQVIWSVGFQEEIHKEHKYLIMYNDFQFPRINNPEIKNYRIQLGKRIPDFFIKRPKEDYIFQCTRHVPEFSSIEVAQFCLRNGVKGIFAGPIADGYPLLANIDNVNTFYLGIISEEEKLKHTKKAKLYTLLHNWPTPFNLSAIESLSYGTPVACTTVGFWPSLIQDKYNGFHCFNEEGLAKAWEMRDSIRQEDCYLSALKYNHYSMIDSVWKALKEVHDS